MTAGQLWVLIGLGVFHGVNPGMGWLLAVSRGLQERSRAALLAALPPIAAGHAVSVAMVAVLITVTGSLTASRWFPVAGGAVLAAAGLWLLLSRRHFHWREVRLSLWQLGVWSFLMASMHGAGLMLLPVLSGRVGHGPGAGGPGGGHGGHGGGGHGAAGPSGPTDPGAHGAVDGSWSLLDVTVLGLAATVVHTLAMFVAVGVSALLAYDFLGVHAMRLRWVTMDRVWAFTLVAGGAFVLWTAM